jgi:hypothetical protein
MAMETAWDQAWFWTEAWQACEREADEDIATERTRRFDSDDEFLAALRNVGRPTNGPRRSPTT